ncbi:hypothetical protein JCM10207_006784 [Rhodosporidiobolus poonsookiae]
MAGFITLRIALAGGKTEQGTAALLDHSGARRSFEDVKSEIESSNGGHPVVILQSGSRIFPSSWSTVKSGEILDVHAEVLPLSPPLSPSASTLDLHRLAGLLPSMSAAVDGRQLLDRLAHGDRLSAEGSAGALLPAFDYPDPHRLPPSTSHSSAASALPTPPASRRTSLGDSPSNGRNNSSTRGGRSPSANEATHDPFCDFSSLDYAFSELSTPPSQSRSSTRESSPGTSFPSHTHAFDRPPHLHAGSAYSLASRPSRPVLRATSSQPSPRGRLPSPAAAPRDGSKPFLGQSSRVKPTCWI